MAAPTETSPSLPRAGEPSSKAYRVKLEVFEGPLDLLLHLIRKNELDVCDIPISLITEQYLQYVALMKELDLEVAGEFVLMAATLVHIKTRMLLPRPPEDAVAEPSEDPRQELVNRLLEHQRYKEAAKELYQREIIQDRIWGRPTGAPITEEGAELVDVSLFDLLSTLRDVIERAKGRIAIEVEADRLTVADRIQRIADALEKEASIPFERLFEDAASRREIIVTFLALLEMIRLRMIRVLQRAAFGSIWVFRRGEEQTAREAIEPKPELEP
ncbi:MAG: segregation/condensation protein A [Acidobacteriota bacterium]